MSVTSVKLKTHSRVDLTGKYLDRLNNCTVHKRVPVILDIVAGRGKDHHYIASCVNDDCGKISMESADDVVHIWNQWNQTVKKLKLKDMAKNSHFLNVGQIREACKKYPYILARFPSGYQMGINSKVIHIAEKRGNHNGNDRTDFVSFLACDFQTYISKKHPFIKT